MAEKFVLDNATRKQYGLPLDYSVGLRPMEDEAASAPDQPTTVAAPQPSQAPATQAAEPAPVTPTVASTNDQWSDPELLTQFHKSSIDDIVKKYTDPANPNPNMSDEDKQAILEHSQALAAQSTPWERTKKTAGIASNEVGRWLLGTAGLGPQGGPGLWKNLSDAKQWASNLNTPIAGETDADKTRNVLMKSAALGTGAGSGFINGGIDLLEAPFKGSFNLGQGALASMMPNDPYYGHQAQADTEGAMDAHSIISDAQNQAQLNKFLNDSFNPNNTTSPGQPTPAQQLQPQLQAGQTLGGLIPGAAIEAATAGMDTGPLLANAAYKGVDLSKVVAGQGLKAAGAVVGNPILRGGAALLAGGGMGHLAEAAVAATPLGNIFPYIGTGRKIINTGLDAAGDAISTAGDILSNSAGKGTIQSAREVIGNKIDDLNDTLDGFDQKAVQGKQNPLIGPYTSQDRITEAATRFQRDAYQGILNNLKSGAARVTNDDSVTNALKSIAQFGGSTLTSTAAGVRMGAGGIQPGDEDSVRAMVDQGMPIGAAASILQARNQRMGAVAADLEKKGANYERTDAGLGAIHDEAQEALPSNLQSEVNRWQGALGRSAEIYILPHDDYVNAANQVGGNPNVPGQFQKIPGEKRRIIIDANTASDPDAFISTLQHEGGHAIDDTLQTQQPQIRQQMVDALKDAYTPQEMSKFTDSYLNNFLPQFNGNKILAKTWLENTAKASGKSLDQYMREELAAEHYSKLISGSSLQDVLTDPGIVQKTASKIKGVLQNIPGVGALIDSSDAASKVNGATQKISWGDLPVANEGIQLARQGFRAFYNDSQPVSNVRMNSRGVGQQVSPQDFMAGQKPDLSSVGKTQPAAPFQPVNNPAGGIYVDENGGAYDRFGRPLQTNKATPQASTSTPAPVEPSIFAEGQNPQVPDATYSKTGKPTTTWGKSKIPIVEDFDHPQGIVKVTSPTRLIKQADGSTQPMNTVASITPNYNIAPRSEPYSSSEVTTAVSELKNELEDRGFPEQAVNRILGSYSDDSIVSLRNQLNYRNQQGATDKGFNHGMPIAVPPPDTPTVRDVSNVAHVSPVTMSPEVKGGTVDLQPAVDESPVIPPVQPGQNPGRVDVSSDEPETEAPSAAAPVNYMTPEHVAIVRNQAAQDFTSSYKGSQTTDKFKSGLAAAQRQALWMAHAANHATDENPGRVTGRVNQDGDFSVAGKWFDPNDPVHNQILSNAGLNSDQLSKLNDIQDAIAKGQPIGINYASALEGKDEPHALERQRAYINSTPDQRQGKEVPFQPDDKLMVPQNFRVAKDGSIFVNGTAVDNIINNAHQVIKSGLLKGNDMPYKGVDDPRLASDIKDYLDNHGHGYGGDGTPLVGVPGVDMAPDPNYTPEKLTGNRLSFINTILNQNTRKTVSETPGKVLNREFAAAQVKPNGQPARPDLTGNTQFNPIAARLEKRGFNLDKLHPSMESLRTSLILPGEAGQSIGTPTATMQKGAQNVATAFGQTPGRVNHQFAAINYSPGPDLSNVK